jgi:OmcA/MtrC family decaheme c-type cytochrome
VANPLFTEIDADGSDGTWEVTLHMAAFVPVDPTIQPSIPNLIAAGTVKRAEIAVLPALKNAAGDTVGLNAPSVTFDLNANAIEPNYYSGTNAIVSVETTTPGTKGCNSCHDQLATTFHSGNRGGNIVVCRMCHVVTSGGSHLEGQSRSIDSYAHAVHRFQAFDVDEVDFTDPVEAKHYEEHISFLFPDFATVNCMACHNAGKFNVPDQSKSMPGVLSATDEIPGVIPATTPEVVTGPAARACGACHRAQFIKENDAGGFTAFNQHTKDFGYRVENDPDDRVLFGVIEKIMSMF